MRILIVLALLMATALPASAHVSIDHFFSPRAGFLHPFTGPDHMAAMVVVGLLAVQGGGARLWVWPTAFICGLIAGAMLGRFYPPSLLIEAGIALSLLAGAALFLRNDPLSLGSGAALIAAVAAIHGAAHGAEAPSSDFVGYVAGFTLATALLHATGIAFGLWLARRIGPKSLMYAGSTVAVLGAAASMSQ